VSHLYLLVGNAYARHQPDDPLHAEEYGRVVGVLQREPGEVGAGDEHIDHGPVAPMEHVLQTLVCLPAETGPGLDIVWRSKGGETVSVSVKRRPFSALTCARRSSRSNGRRSTP